MSTEHVNHQINLLIQGHSSHRKSIDSAFDAIKQLSRQVYELEQKIERLERKMITSQSPKVR